MKEYKKKLIERQTLSKAYEGVDKIPLVHFAFMTGRSPATVEKAYPNAIISENSRGERTKKMIKRSLCK